MLVYLMANIGLAMQGHFERPGNTSLTLRSQHMVGCWLLNFLSGALELDHLSFKKLYYCKFTYTMNTLLVDRNPMNPLDRKLRVTLFVATLLQPASLYSRRLLMVLGLAGA